MKAAAVRTTPSACGGWQQPSFIARYGFTFNVAQPAPMVRVYQERGQYEAAEPLYVVIEHP